MMQPFNNSVKISNNLALVWLAARLSFWFGLCLCLLATPAHCDSLPATTSAYYTVVSAGFDNLNFSFHYYEYGNTSMGLCSSVGRYYEPSAVEWIDSINGGYYLQVNDLWPIPNCKAYQLATVENSRLLGCATALLQNLDSDNVVFTNLGVTSSVRSQPSVQYSTQMSYTSQNVNSMYSSLDEFLLQAYSTASVDTSSPYSVNVAINVYYSSDSQGRLIAAGNGYTPLRFTITGTRTDVNGARPINIVYDFMQWSQLEYVYALLSVTPPNNGFCSSGTSLPTIPTITALPLSNRTIPLDSWNNCTRATMELAASVPGAVSDPLQILQIDSLLWPQNGLEIVTSVADTSQYISNSMMFDYTAPSNYQFSKGFAWLVNGTNFIPGPSADPVTTLRPDAVVSGPCNYTIISPLESPLQWAFNAGVLDTIIANTTFLSGAQFTGRQSIRGIVADSWAVNINFKAKNVGVTYSFALQVYTTTTGWTNMGRVLGPSMGRQLLRLAYNGVSSATGAYTLQTDFFMQYKWNVSVATFNPKYYNCITPSV